jgi:hypothetical protein
MRSEANCLPSQKQFQFIQTILEPRLQIRWDGWPLGLIIGERNVNMNKQMKNVLLAGIMILLFSACGKLETTPTLTEAPELIVTVTENPTRVPTAASTEGVAPEKFSKYIGLNYPPLPAGLSESLGMLIQDANDHSLSLVLDGANKMLWLSKLSHTDSNGNAYWEVKDVLELSNLEAGLVLAPDGCFLNGQPDHEIFVVVKNGTILLAWRANTTSNVFEVIPTNGIECHSDKGMSLD